MNQILPVLVQSYLAKKVFSWHWFNCLTVHVDLFADNGISILLVVENSMLVAAISPKRPLSVDSASLVSMYCEMISPAPRSAIVVRVFEASIFFWYAFLAALKPWINTAILNCCCYFFLFTLFKYLFLSDSFNKRIRKFGHKFFFCNFKFYFLMVFLIFLCLI